MKFKENRPQQKKEIPITKPRIGIALGGGGAKGISHIGILEILEKNNLIPVEITGCSIGSIIGAIYASGLSIEHIKEIALSITFKQLINLFDFADPKEGGIIKGKLVEKFLESKLPVKKFEDLKIPFKCVATDALTGKPVIFEKGDLVPAIRASISIPGFFIPYNYKGKILIDGSLSNPIPVNLLTHSDYKIAVVVDEYKLYSKVSEKSRKIKSRMEDILEKKIFPKIESIPVFKNIMKHKGFKTIQILSSSYDMIFKELSDFNIENYEKDIIIKPNVLFIPLLAFHRGKKSYKKGIKAAKKAISIILSDIQNKS